MKPDDPRHGTDAGYKAHARSRDLPCEKCLAAHSRYEIDRRNRVSMNQHKEKGVTE